MLAGSLLLAAALLTQAPQAADDAATPIARYHLRLAEVVVTRGDVALEMAFHLRRKDDGRAACAQLAKTELVRRAAAAKGAWPEPATVRARLDELRQQLRAAGRDPDREPIFRNCSEAALLDYLAIDVAHERVVRKELGLRDDEQVSPAMLELWVKEARQRATIVDDPDQLPAGTAVRVDGRDVPLLDLGMLLLRSSDRDEQAKFVRQVVVLQSLEAMARERNLTVSADELQNELSLCRAQARSDPRFRGLTFEQLLNAQGITVEWLLQSRVFRAQVLQKKLVALQHPRQQLLAELAADRPGALERYGPRRHLAVVFARALDEPNQLVPRDFAAAQKHLEQCRQRLEHETFDNVARIESDDPGSKLRGGDCGWLQRRARELPEPVLAAAWSLDPGAVSEPVRAADGCYLVKVLEIEPDLSDDALVDRMREQKIEALTTELLRTAAIVHADGTPLSGDATPSNAGGDAGR